MDPVAVYAAIAATASLAWQVYSWWSEHTVRVRVVISEGIVVGGPDLVFITVIIRSKRHPVRVAAAGIRLQDGSRRYTPVMDPLLPDHALPQTIPPQDSGQTSMPISTLHAAGIDLRRPMVAHVHLGRGEWVYSKPKQLRASG